MIIGLLMGFRERFVYLNVFKIKKRKRVNGGCFSFFGEKRGVILYFLS